MWTCARTAIQGPFGSARSDNSRIGVQLTDSAYVPASMRIMTRMGRDALDVLGDSGSFVPCLHFVGVPLPDGVRDVPWPAPFGERLPAELREQLTRVERELSERA